MVSAMRHIIALVVVALCAISGAGVVQAAPTPPPATAALPAAPTTLPAICTQKANIVCASLTERKLRYFENGVEWLATDVRFGRPGFETPKGTWQVATKAQNSWWSYPYKVYMPWGIKFDSRIGLYIHYSSGFSLNPATYVGSHGCIQIGDWETAKKLYNRLPVGATVHTY